MTPPHPSASKSLLFSITFLVLLTAVFIFAANPVIAAPQTRYVDGAGGLDSGSCSSAADPCKTISYALNQAKSGDAVKVARGIYKENLLLKADLELLGGFTAGDWEAAPTPYGSVIDGRRLDAAVRYEDGVSGTLDGFKITNGKAGLGGGVFSNLGAPLLQNLWIVDNEAADSGGGVYLSQGQGAISNSKIEDNRAANFGGGIYIASSSSNLSDLTITGNKAASGGGISLESTGKITLADSEVARNEGAGQSGAIHLADAFLDIEESVIAGNMAGDHGGAMTAEGSRVRITNGLFHGNSTTSGMASVLDIDASEVLVTNSTFADNAPQGLQAVLMRGTSGRLDLKNSIMWNNSLNYLSDPPCLLPAVCFKPSYSNIQGLGAGEGNIDKDPLFLNPGKGNYRLGANSPCIDAGTTTGAPPADLDGRPRDGSPDMGAYEYAEVHYTHHAHLPTILGR